MTESQKRNARRQRANLSVKDDGKHLLSIIGDVKEIHFRGPFVELPWAKFPKSEAEWNEKEIVFSTVCEEVAWDWETELPTADLDDIRREMTESIKEFIDHISVYRGRGMKGLIVYRARLVSADLHLRTGRQRRKECLVHPASDAAEVAADLLGLF